MFFTRFVDEVANKFKNIKQALVGFIGILEKIRQPMKTQKKHRFTQDRSQAVREWMYNNEDDMQHRYTFGQPNDSTQAMIDSARTN